MEVAFAKCPQLKIQDYTSRDIKKFVSETFASVTGNLYPGEKVVRISDKLISKIVRKAEGVFIWVRLVLAELLVAIEARDIDALDQKLEDLPSDLEELYSRIVEKIPVTLRHHTFNYLQPFAPIEEIKNTTKSMRFRHRYVNPDIFDLKTIFHLSVAIEPAITAIEFPSMMMTDNDKVSVCLKTKGLVQERCRGLISLPSFDPTWDLDEMVKRFCEGRVSIHKTVLDYLFSEKNIGKLCSGVDHTLLEEPYIQRAAYYLRRLKVGFPTLRLFLGSPPTSVDSRRLEKCRVQWHTLFVGVFYNLLKHEDLPNSTPLRMTWLPPVEAYFNTVFRYRRNLEDFYIHFFPRDDYFSNTCIANSIANRSQKFSSHHPDLELVATYLHLNEYRSVTSSLTKKNWSQAIDLLTRYFPAREPQSRYTVDLDAPTTI
jgi:hypothetical protein